MSDRVNIRNYTESFKANVDKLKLEQNGVECWLMNKQDSSYLHMAPGSIELYVAAEDVENASELIGVPIEE